MHNYKYCIWNQEDDDWFDQVKYSATELWPLNKCVPVPRGKLSHIKAILDISKIPEYYVWCCGGGCWWAVYIPDWFVFSPSPSLLRSEAWSVKESDMKITVHSSRHPASDAPFNLKPSFAYPLFYTNSFSELFVIYVFIYLLTSYLFDDTIYLVSW